MPRIFVAATGRNRRVIAAYAPTWRMCLIDPAFARREDVSAEMLAAAIVHEATHARLLHLHGRCAQPPERIEQMCIRRDKAFPETPRSRNTIDGASGSSTPDPRSP